MQVIKLFSLLDTLKKGEILGFLLSYNKPKNHHIKMNEEEITKWKAYLKKLTDEELKLCYNEYMRRWKKNNKPLVNAYKRNHYKKFVGNTNKDSLKNVGNTNKDSLKNVGNTNKDSLKNVGNTPKINPLDILNRRN